MSRINVSVACPVCTTEEGEGGSVEVSLTRSYHGSNIEVWSGCDSCGCEEFTDAQRDAMYSHAIAAYDGPGDGDAWSGGFAENH